VKNVCRKTESREQRRHDIEMCGWARDGDLAKRQVGQVHPQQRPALKIVQHCCMRQLTAFLKFLAMIAQHENDGIVEIAARIQIGTSTSNVASVMPPKRPY